MKRIYYIISALFLAAAVFTGCSKDEIEEKYLDVIESDVDFQASGGTGVISLSTNADRVIASSNEYWLRITSASPEAVEFEVSDHSGEFSRAARISVYGGGITRQIVVSQMGVVFAIGSEDIENGISINPEGGQTEIAYSLNSSSAPKIYIADSWLEAGVDESGKIIFSAQTNLSGAARSTTVRIVASWKAVELTVSQDRVPLLETKEFAFDRDAVQEIVNTTQWAASMEWSVSTDASWITVEKTSDGAISLSVSENTSGANRSGEVYMLNAGGDVVETISISQKMWSYNFFLGQWTLNSSDANVPVIFEEDVYEESYIMYVYDESFGSFPIFVTYDGETATMNMKTQYVDELTGLIDGYYFWWCGAFGTSLTWSTDAGMNMVFNMNEESQALECEDDGTYSSAVEGFLLYVFSSETPTTNNVEGYWARFRGLTAFTR